MTEVIFTHKGWIGLCPVYVANPKKECPEVEIRYPGTGWLLDLSLWLFDLIGSTTGVHDGSIPIRLTGRIK
jgi:hypothetical protein